MSPDSDTGEARRTGGGPDTLNPLIDMRGVSRTYPGPPPLEALTGVDLVVNRGDYLAIVGPSGSGKSTLLNVLGLLDEPTAGRYRLAGLDTTALGDAERTALRGRRIGFIFQEFNLLAERTAAENVEIGQLYNSVPHDVRRRNARSALARVGLADRADALPSALSGGQRQRVAIARAIINKPDLLLCDEPTGNLDSTTSLQIAEVFADLHHAGATIILITHDPALAARADARLSIFDGHLLASGTDYA